MSVNEFIHKNTTEKQSFNWSVKTVSKLTSSRLVKKLRRKIYKDRPKYVPQAFGGVKDGLESALEVTKSLEQLLDRVDNCIAHASSKDLRDGALKRIESFLLTVISMNQQTTALGYISTISLYLTTWCDKSLAQTLIEHCKTLIPKHGLEEQAGFLTNSFDVIINGPFGAAISKIVSLLIVGGFLPQQATTNMGRGLMELFHVRRFSDDGSSLKPFIDCILGTLDWVIDTAWPAVVLGNPKLLFISERAADLDMHYRKVLDVTDLYMGQNFELLEKKFGFGRSGAEVVSLIDECMQMHEDVKRKSGDVQSCFPKGELQRRLINLDKLSNGVQGKFKEFNTRVRPFTFLLRGGSGVNKTQLNVILLHAMSKANNFPEGPDFHCQFNEGDPYMSDFEKRHISVTFDDLCNTKAEREQNNPLFKIIQFCNNQHCTALSAEAHLKGKKDINVKLVSATTNSEELNASYWSTCPSSILSRFNMIIDVELNPVALDERGKIDKRFLGETMPDMWRLTPHWVRVDRVDHMTDKYHLVPFDCGHDIVDLVDLVVKESTEWFSKQNKLVQTNKRLNEVKHCRHHPYFTVPCLKCLKRGPPVDSVVADFEMMNIIEDYETGPLENQAEEIQEEIFHDACETAWNVGRNDPHDGYFQNARSKELFTWTPTQFTPFGNNIDMEPGVTLINTAYEDTVRIIEEPFVSLSSLVKTYVSKLKETIMQVDPKYKILAIAVSTTALLFAAAAFYRKVEECSEQASISSVNAVAMPPKVIAERDDTYKKVVKIKDMDFSSASCTATMKQFLDKVDVGIMNCAVTPVLNHAGDLMAERTQSVTATPIRGGYWILPRHVFRKKHIVSPVGQFHLSLRATLGDNHKKFEQIIELSDIVQADTDLCAVKLTRGGCTYDFSKFMPEGEKIPAVGTTVQLLCRSNDMLAAGKSPTEGRIMAKVTGKNVVNVHTGAYLAITYDTNEPTFVGLCGALVCTVGDNPQILGFHTAGVTNECKGAASMFVKEDYELQSGCQVMLAEKQPPPTRSLGTEFTLADDCKWKSPVFWIPDSEEVSFEYLGQHDLPTTRFQSKVCPSILCDKLEEVGIERKHSGPLRTAETMARQKHLLSCSKLRPPRNPMLARRAMDDFKAKIKTAFDASKDQELDLAKHIHPISYEDALNGVEGVQGFDPIPPNTAPGFGRTGPKWKLCIQEAIDEKKKGNCPRLYVEKTMEDGTIVSTFEYQFDDEKLNVREEVEKLFTDFTEGVRSNVIMKCNLKDEALPLEKVLKGKLRVFAGAPMTLVIVARMIFSTSNVLMTMFPTLFESAVGVNATGKDWHRIGTFVKKFGEDRCWGGDFGEYDTSIECDWTINAFEMLKYMLSLAGQPQWVLDLVDGVACEVCFPIYEVNGVLVQIDGSNPSGHPLTVIINGLVNALLMRYCYYAVHQENGDDLDSLPPFHHVVALMTYGDDNCGSISRKEELFNHVSVAKQLAKLGMRYTMPDKNSDPKPFIPFSDLDFLKRKFGIHPVTGTMIGALDIASIYKSLTTTMKVKGREENEVMIMAGNIANALSELWCHSPTVFQEHKRKFEQLKDVTNGDFTIREFWRDVTEAECLERYNKTTSVYDLCIQKANLPYECQAEEYDAQSALGDLPRVARLRIRRNLNAFYMLGITRYYVSLIQYDIGDVLVHQGVMSVIRHNTPQTIYHMKPDPGLLRRELCIRERKKRWRNRLVRELESVFLTPRVPYLKPFCCYSIILKRMVCGGTLKTAQLWRRILLRHLLPEHLHEVRDLIQEYAAPVFMLFPIPDVNANGLQSNVWYLLSSRSDSRSKQTPCGSALLLKELDTDVSKYVYEEQSELVTNPSVPDTQKQRMLKFHDENPSYRADVSSTDDPTRNSAANVDASLATFFERPVRIASPKWTPGSSLNVLINPWELWMDNRRVANRLSNFANFRANLHIKIIINGNSFHWGSAMASYMPLANSPMVPHYRTEAGFTADLMAASQRPKILIDPTTSQAGEMVLPFFWLYDNWDIAVSDMRQMGQIWLTSFTDLHNSNGSTDPLYMTVYAWATDVKLSAPTCTNIAGLQPQADEYDDSGPVSKPAAIVSKIAGKLEKAPVIGPYALASRMAADTVGNIARNFGYCRPRVVDNPQLYKNVQVGDLATTDAVDTSMSLALTSKREVTIDPRVSGIGSADELSLEYLAGKESYLCTAPWRVANGVGHLIFNAPVTPMLCFAGARSFPPSAVGTALTPAGLAASMFKYWKGTMVMRFQFVGSAYHKGRVAVQWDPRANSNTEQNVVFTEIVDVSSKRDFTVEIGWGAPWSALSVGDIPGLSNWHTDSWTTYNGSIHNGRISVRVDNGLVSSADSTTPVYFNVFVSWKDLELFAPNGDNFSSFTPMLVPPAVTVNEGMSVKTTSKDDPIYKEQSEEIVMGDAKAVTNAAPDEAETIAHMGGGSIPTPAVWEHGDPIQSLRQFAKRFSLQESIIFQESATPTNINRTQIARKLGPINRGPATNGIHGNVNYVSTTPLTWLSMCYAGFRGSMRYKIYPRFDPRWQHWVRVNRTSSVVPANLNDFESIWFGDFHRASVTSDESACGRVLSAQTMNDILEFEMPYYNTARFLPNYYEPAGNHNDCWIMTIDSKTRPTDVTESNSWIDVYSAAGDDWNLFFFTGVPMVYEWEGSFTPT